MAPPASDAPTGEPPNGEAEHGTLHSVGAAARLTSLSAATLRVWERRYGRPVPVRLPSGHRRYTGAQVRWLRRVAEALSTGRRASEVVPLDESALEALLTSRTTHAEDPDVERRVELARSYKNGAIVAELETLHAEIGTRRLLREHVAPLVTAIGRAWADGTLDVRHEHAATEHLAGLLVRLQQQYARESGDVVLLTTLPGETHAMGLRMAALEAAAAGYDVRVLGAETPLEEIVRAAVESEATSVALSISLSTGGPDTDRRVADLRSALPQSIELVVGGAGARGPRRGVRGVKYASGLDDFAALLADASRHAA